MAQDNIKSGKSESMDDAAQKAKQELDNLPDAAKRIIGDWFKKWYMSAGHKRLGRLLVQEEKKPSREDKSDKIIGYFKRLSFETEDPEIMSYISDIEKIPRLRRSEEQKLVRRVKENDDDNAKERLIAANLWFVVEIAHRFQNSGVPMADLISAGNAGLVRALEKFDHRRGFRLKTYAIWWVKRAIYEAISAQKSLVRKTYLARRIEIETRKFIQKHGREPTSEELARLLHVDAEVVLHSLIEIEVPYSIEDICQILENPRAELVPHDIRDSRRLHSPSPEEVLVQKIDRERLQKAMNMLGRRERELLERNFGLGEYNTHTLEEISRIMNIKRERVRQIRENALRKLKIVLSDGKLGRLA